MFQELRELRRSRAIPCITIYVSMSKHEDEEIHEVNRENPNVSELRKFRRNGAIRCITSELLVRLKYLYEKGGKAMAYFPPVPAIRRNLLIKGLRQTGAVSRETAVTLSEAGIINPNGFKLITDLLVKRGIILQEGNKFYLGLVDMKVCN